jgi:Ca2+-binding RTX toxin-like protein
VVELEEGSTIADYELVSNDDGSTTIASDTHSVTFRSTGGLPEFQAPGDNNDDDDTDTPPVDNGGDDNSNDDHDDDDGDQEDNDDGTVIPPVDPVDEQPGTNPSGPKVGTPETDVLIGDGGDDSITGFAGDDVLIGYAGNDIILGGNGNDFIAGWDGKDIIWGGTGNDTAFGGSGNDAIEGEDGDDRLFGEAGDDMITAGNGNDTVVGGEGNDWLIAGNGDGNDVYFGDEINDASGTPHSDTLDMSTVTANTKVDLGTALGGMGSATSSQTGTDTLWGIENVVTGSGNDTIKASASVNVMDGGSGNDTFVFSSAAQANGDTIVGFETGDKIDLSGIDANGGASGNQPFTLVSNGAITAPAQIAVTQETIDGQDYTVISGNTAGNDNAEFKIKIEGSHDLTTSNFIL